MIEIPSREFKPVNVVDPDSGINRDCFLVKYERRQYGTIRVGTLEYFRNLEANQGDHLDGRVEGVVFEPGQDTRVTSAELSTITGGSLKVVARDGINFGPQGKYKDQFHRRCHNIYVFCCSMEFGAFPNKERMNHFGAKEFFVIDDTKSLKEFVALELQKQARTSDGRSFEPSKHYLMSWEAPVRYLPRKNAKMDLPINNLDFFVYQKDPKFKIEQEYRFAWVFFDKASNKPVDVAPNPIDIPISMNVGTAHVKFD